MTPIKNYIATQFLNKKFRFTCDCLIPIDITGIVRDYEIKGIEIVLFVSREKDGKIIHIGLNTPSLQIEEITGAI
jgi:hypothetical protein